MSRSLCWRGFFFICYKTSWADTNPKTMQYKKNTSLDFVPAIPRSPDTHSLTHSCRHTHTLKPTLEDREISERVAEWDRSEVQEANVTTVSISSKLDLFLSAPWKTLRLVVVLCFHHPEAPRPGACWVPTWHRRNQVAALQVHTFGNLGCYFVLLLYNISQGNMALFS